MALWQDACRGRGQACGRAIGRIAVGCRADLVTLDREHPALLGKTGALALDSAIFAANALPLSSVFVGGRRLVSGWAPQRARGGRARASPR